MYSCPIQVIQLLSPPETGSDSQPTLVGSYTNSPNTVRNPLEADDAVLYTI